jgi:ectoine hydroxylase-related dioxygenase (phytanoyl-CoA dioxygenase family)
LRYPKAEKSHVEFFEEHGWLVVEDVVEPAELAEVQRRCQVILDKKDKLAFDWAWERGKSKAERAFKIVQGSPTLVWPEIANAPFRRWALAFASELMRRDVEFWYDQFLAKPARDGAPTYWHQDEAYWGRNLDDRGVTCWLPLHDVDPTNGCMHFTDRGHKDGILPHRQPEHVQSDLLLRARSDAHGALPDPRRQRDLPSRQDAAHDPSQCERRLAPRGHDAHAGRGHRGRGRSLPVEGLREPGDGRTDRPAVAMIDALLARRPEVAFEAELPDGAIEAFRERGFTSVPRITSDEELAWLGELYDWLFAEKVQTVPGGYFDLSRPYESDGPDLQPQILSPETRFPALRRTALFRNGRRIAALLLGVAESELRGWGHMIRKPARVGAALPWHQDEAYWDPAFDYRALGCWSAHPRRRRLHDFIPGSHAGRRMPPSRTTRTCRAPRPTTSARAQSARRSPGGAISATAARCTPRLTRARACGFCANEFSSRPWREALSRRGSTSKRAWGHAGLTTLASVAARGAPRRLRAAAGGRGRRRSR